MPRATRVPLDRIADLISANQILLVAACTDSCADYSLVDRPQTPSIHPSIHHASYYTKYNQPTKYVFMRPVTI